MSTKVVYYSRYGNARYVAHEIASRTQAELIELQESRPRTGVVGFVINGMRASRKKGTELRGQPWDDARGAELIYLITPVWAGNTTPAINTFLEKADLSGVTVHTVTIQADPEAGRSDDIHDDLGARIQIRGGTQGSRSSLHSAPPGKFAGEPALQQQVDKVVPRQ